MKFFNLKNSVRLIPASKLSSAIDKAFLKSIQQSLPTRFISFAALDFFADDIKMYELKQALDKNATLYIFDLARFINSKNLFTVQNRKYLGSKYNLLDFLESIILKKTGGVIKSFFAPFAGSGVVACHFNRYTEKLIASDLLFSNSIVLKAFLCSTRNNVSIKNIKELIEHLNNLAPHKGYIFNNFSGTYFTSKNAAKIDAIRQEIENLYTTGICTEQEMCLLLASLLYATDKVANTVGQYDAFLKNIGNPSYSQGKHKVDINVYRELYLKRPFIFFNDNNRVYNMDANTLVKKVKAQVAYLDPPYNHRQYVDCYHLLENIMLWQKPPLYGKTKKFKREYLKSPYSQKTAALASFTDLIQEIDCNHLFLSYNNEGIIKDQDIIRVLEQKGKLEVFKKDYRIFGHGAGVSKKRHIKERLFYCRVYKQ